MWHNFPQSIWNSNFEAVAILTDVRYQSQTLSVHNQILDQMLSTEWINVELGHNFDGSFLSAAAKSSNPPKNWSASIRHPREGAPILWQLEHRIQPVILVWWKSQKSFQHSWIGQWFFRLLWWTPTRKHSFVSIDWCCNEQGTICT